jgi:hypothetical protein
MFSKLLLIVMMCLSFVNFVSLSVNAAESSLMTREKIKSLVQNYYEKQIYHNKTFKVSDSGLSLLENQFNNNCDPDGDERVSCVTELCKHTSCYGSTGQQIATSCRGANGRCVQELCKSTSCYGSTGQDIAVACRGSSGLCVEELCKSTSCYGSTGQDIAKACKGSDGQCVVELCKSTSCYGSTGQDIARSCAGH